MPLLELFPRTPEYWHVVLNHMPIEGLMIATLVLLIGILFKHKAVQRAGLFVVLVSSLSAWPVYWLGDAGYDRVTAKTDELGQNWLDDHEERAEKGIYVFTICGVIAMLSLLISMKSDKWSNRLTYFTLLACIASIACGGWIAYAGGKVIHREFRLKHEAPDKEDSEQIAVQAK